MKLRGLLAAALCMTFTVSPVFANDVTWEMNGYRGRVQSAESRWKDKNVSGARFFIDDAKATAAKASAAMKEQPEFAQLQARLAELEKQVATAEVAGKREADAASKLDEAASNRQFGRMHLEDRSWSQAIEAYDRCLKRADEAFKIDAGAKTREVHGQSPTILGEGLRKECAEGQAKAKVGLESATKAEIAELEKQASTLHKNKWPNAVAMLAEARKLSKDKDELAILDADSQYAGVEEQLFDLVGLLERGVQRIPAFERSKLDGAPVGEVLRKSKAMIGESKAERAAIEGRVTKAEASWKKAFGAAMTGERKKLFNQRGVPSFWENATVFGARKRIAAAAKSSYFRYTSSACDVHYRFKGNSLAKTDATPLGCNR